MKASFPAVLNEVLAHEGGYVNHPKDPGGETNFGISKRSYPNLDIRNLTKADAAEIYRSDYWDRVRGDDLPAGVDLVAMDGAVNSGVSRGAKWIQKAVGVTADGQVGPQTLAALSGSDALAVIKKACALRMSFLRGLGTWSTFSKGWSRRVASVEAEGTRLALEAQGRNSNEVIAHLAGAARDAVDSVKSKTGAAIGAVVAGATSAGVSAADVAGATSEMGLIGVAMGLVASVITWIRRGHQIDRAAAFKLALQAVVERRISPLDVV